MTSNQPEPKRKKLDSPEKKEPTPEEVFKTRLVGQILAGIEQKENTGLREELTAELAQHMATLTFLPSLSETLRSSFIGINPTKPAEEEVIVISDDEKSAAKPAATQLRMRLAEQFVAAAIILLGARPQRQPLFKMEHTTQVVSAASSVSTAPASAATVKTLPASTDTGSGEFRPPRGGAVFAAVE